MNNRIIHIVLLSVLLMQVSCKSEYKPDNGVIEKIEIGFGNNSILGNSFAIDYTNSMDSGFVFPSKNQSADGMMDVKIHVAKLDPGKKYYFKLFYQNESYKFDELTEKDELVTENYYGSWEDPGLGFVEVSDDVISKGEGVISSKIRMVGNPRNESLYYNIQDFVVNEDSVAHLISDMKNTPEWNKDILQKAKENNRKVEDQMRLDALFMLEALYKEKKSTKKKRNLRWERNMRVGKYSLMAVLVESEGLQKIPANAQNICSKIDYKFKNPYKYFLSEQTLFSKQKNGSGSAAVFKVPDAFTLKAKVDFTKGIYVEDRDYKPIYPFDYFNSKCNRSIKLDKEAQIEQFFHSLDFSETLNNIPVIADVAGDNYTRAQYEGNAKKYGDAQRIKRPVDVTDCPCKTLAIDSVANTVSLTNPAATKDKMKKEDVGISTRNGFTYGKYTVKIKMPEQLNRFNIWNGLTNAIWLINKGGDEWNMRRVCDKSGYIPKHNPDKNVRKKQQSYSEIDFEIVKCAQYWPKTSYPNPLDYKIEEKTNAQNVMVTCTNWDLACDDVADYIVGALTRQMGDNKYVLHRWDSWYKALTTKTSANEDELFASPYYYFQIDWSPKEIIWRIGPEKNKLREVARMNDQVTKIPNNQMVLIITQEYHLTNWWPEAPFSQDNVPFPAKDHVGTVYSIEIE